MTFKARILLISVLLAAALSSCKNNSHKGGSNQFPPASGVTPTDSGKTNPPVSNEVRAVQNESGWGYEIYIDKKLFIRQPFIPVISGLHAFKSKEDAMKTGNFVLKKYLSGETRPALTLDDLKALQIVQ